MPTKRVERIKSWSYSRYSTYEKCPALAKYKFIEKRQEPGSTAMDRGSDIHLMAEHAVKGTAPPATEFKALAPAHANGTVELLKKGKLPEELGNFTKEFAAARKTKGVETELMLAFTSQWDACDWRDWNRAWVRIKIDLLLPPTIKAPVVKVIDHKTGRPRDDYDEQLELYAIGAFLRYPQAATADTRLWYLDQGLIAPDDPKEGVFKRAELPKLIKLWEQRITPMLNDAVFAPRPGPQCRWCAFSKAKSGPCVY